MLRHGKHGLLRAGGKHLLRKNLLPVGPHLLYRMFHAVLRSAGADLLRDDHLQRRRDVLQRRLLRQRRRLRERTLQGVQITRRVARRLVSTP